MQGSEDGRAARVCDICPLMLPASPLGRSYRGYISVEVRAAVHNGQDYALCLTMPSTGEIKNARLECDWMLSQVLKGKEPLLQKMLQESEDVASFLSKLKQTLDHTQSSHPAMLPPPPLPLAHYRQLLVDLEQIGWQRVVHVSTDFAHIKIRTLDTKQREHVFTVHMAQQLEGSPSITCDLPLPFKPSWSEQTTISEVVRGFEEQLCVHQAFWDVMDELDRDTWVLEPEKPSPGCNYRRIVVCSNVSLYVTVDPRRPSNLPQLRFLGPEPVVDPIRLKMMARVTQWDPNLQVSLKQNLETLLDLTLPGPEAAQKEHVLWAQELAVDLNGVVADIVCNNRHCNQPFHFACLSEWLQTVPTTRKSFGTLFGECPYCNEQISIKLH